MRSKTGRRDTASGRGLCASCETVDARGTRGVTWMQARDPYEHRRKRPWSKKVRLCCSCDIVERVELGCKSPHRCQEMAKAGKINKQCTVCIESAGDLL